MEPIKIAAYFPAHPSAKDASKTVPPKFKDGNDREFTIDKGLVEFVAAHQGQTIEAEWEETQNGKWTNRKLTGATIPTTPASAEKPQGNGWKRDPAESSLILRQVALKAAVELAAKALPMGLDGIRSVVLETAEIFNDWLHERTAIAIAAGSPHYNPEQRAAQEATRTGGRYDTALAAQKPHVATTIKPDQSLGAAVAEVLANHDPMADDERPPHPADAYGRETLRPSGAPRR